VSCPRSSRIHRLLLEDVPLGPEDARHVATCGACRRIAASVDRLDDRLRVATRGLASQTVPDRVLEAEPMTPRLRDRLAPASGLAATTSVAVAVIIAFAATTQLRPPVAIEPNPDLPSGAAVPSPSDVPASVVPSPTATPVPSAAPGPQATDAHLVGPLDHCFDGIGGFSYMLPAEWYANRRDGEQPACRAVGTVRDVDGHQLLDAVIFLDVGPDRPAWPDATVTPVDERALENGIHLETFLVETPESGALAASRELVAVATLAEDRVLTMSTDPDQPTWVDTLKTLGETLQVGEPFGTNPEAAAQASELYQDRDVCQDPERGLAVIFPEAWWTNTAVDELPACSWFAREAFVYESADVLPGGVLLTMELFDGDFGTFHPVASHESVTVIGEPATRWLLDFGTGLTYQYVIGLGDIPESGPTLVVGTTATDVEDLPLAMAVLDELVQHITFAPPPPDATTTNPPLTGTPISASATDGDFELTLSVKQARYRAGQPILADATLSYSGSESSVRLWGSGLGVVGTSVRQLDGPINPGFATTSDCQPHDIAAESQMHVPFRKSGSFSEDDPLIEFYRAFFADPLLRLPPGRWEIVATTSATIGGEDCGSGPGLGVRVSVEIVVEP